MVIVDMLARLLIVCNIEACRALPLYSPEAAAILAALDRGRA